MGHRIICTCTTVKISIKFFSSREVSWCFQCLVAFVFIVLPQLSEYGELFEVKNKHTNKQKTSFRRVQRRHSHTLGCIEKCVFFKKFCNNRIGNSRGNNFCLNEEEKKLYLSKISRFGCPAYSRQGRTGCACCVLDQPKLAGCSRNEHNCSQCEVPITEGAYLLVIRVASHFKSPIIFSKHFKINCHFIHPTIQEVRT